MLDGSQADSKTFIEPEVWLNDMDVRIAKNKAAMLALRKLMHEMTADASNEKLIPLVEASVEVQQIIRENVDTLRTICFYQDDSTRKIVRMFRESRMSISSELKALLSGLSDVRQFTMSKEHEEQTRRLSEFITLCERLQKLKDSGFLDVVADTILKLA